MKNAEQQLATTLAENLHASIGGLNEKHTKKLLKKVAEAARMLARKHAKLLAKEQRKAHPAARQQPVVSRKSAKAAKSRIVPPATPDPRAARAARAATKPASAGKAALAAVG